MVSCILEYGHNGTFSPYGLGVFGNYITQKVGSLLPCNLYEITLILCLWDTTMYDKNNTCCFLSPVFFTIIIFRYKLSSIGWEGRRNSIDVLCFEAIPGTKVKYGQCWWFRLKVGTSFFFFWIDKENVLMIKEGMHDVCKATKRPKKVAGDTKTSICALYGA